jgi:hypothetical protein
VKCRIAAVSASRGAACYAPHRLSGDSILG